MSDKKFYKKLPVVQQTTAIKNFFESTVEQLFSKAETESVQGFIGSRRNEDANLEGKYLSEPTVTKRFYGLSPVVNTIDEDTGDSTNLIFYDEFIDTLKTYNVNVKNQNKIFGERFSSFMPPIDADKLLNYAEYYWYPQGPSTIEVTGTLADPINVDTDVLGQPQFNSPNGVTLRNGMIVQFSGEYVIPASKTGKEYIVEGVGQSIMLLPKAENYSTRFTEIEETPYDEFNSGDLTLVKHFTGGKVDSITVENGGIGYVSPQILIYDDSVSENLASAYPSLATSYLDESGNLVEIVAFEQIVDTVTQNGSISEYNALKTIIDTNRSGVSASVTTSANNSGVVTATIDNSGTNYSGTIYVRIYDVGVSTQVHIGMTAALQTYSGSVFATDQIVVVNNSNIKVGQSVTCTGELDFSATVVAVDGTTVTLDKSVFIDDQWSNGDAVLTFKGRNFQPKLTMSYLDESDNDTFTVTATPGINPNNANDYYYVNLESSWDKDLTGDNIGDVPWAGIVRSAQKDYILQQRGAPNRNVWSRVNFWYHRDNFIDAGDAIPGREYRANRPIIEFDRYLELYNHGTAVAGIVNIVSTEYTIADLEGSATDTLVDGYPLNGALIAFVNETPANNKYIYRAEIDSNVLTLKRVADPVNNPTGTADGETGFIPLEVQANQTIQVSGGLQNIGKEFVYNGTEWSLAQEKISVNQAPLFNLYDDNGIVLDDIDVYPNSEFAGNKIFGYATTNTSNDADVLVSSTADSELGFPLVYRQYKSSSEIVFQNYQEASYYYQVPTQAVSSTRGYNYYLLTKEQPEYHSYWKEIDTPYRQRIVTTYEITQLDIDANRKTFSIGCLPDRNSSINSGYDIIVKVNNVPRTDFTYGSSVPSFIDFDTPTFKAGDYIEISAYSSRGVISLDNSSKFEMPLGWGHNVHKQDITSTSEPEFLPHFRDFIQNQNGFTGDSLASNNFSNTAKDEYYADNIIQSNQDLILGAYLLDDQPHNLVDAMRYTAGEYIKYKNRLRNEIDKIYSESDTTDYTVEQLLETVLRRLISFKVGREVFNRTYILPFGDNYETETQIAGFDQTTFTFTFDSDLDALENSVLVYYNDNLLCVDRCYVVTSYSPFTIELQARVPVTAGDVIVAKLYNANRDSAQCPPTPSTMGITPLFQPEIITDYTYADPIDVIVGHDGSRTPVVGDIRDTILMNFERRIYNSAKAEFRERNSQLDYNLFEIKSGAFRNTGYTLQEWHDLMRHYYAIWTSTNAVDPVVNEFYDENDSWTWNYRGTSIPGYWKGIYEFYYDTQRPNTNPWEMLGFTEKPLWWDEQYTTDYTSANTAMWSDLEQGIIRQGPRENITNDRYVINNPYRRLGLHSIIPVDANGNLISPYELFSTGTTTSEKVWSAINNLNHLGYRTESFVDTSNAQFDGVTISVDDVNDSANSNVYIESYGVVNHTDGFNTVSEYADYVATNGNPIREQQISFTIPYKDLNVLDVVNDITPMIKGGAIGVLVNGLPLYNIDRDITWNDQGEWHYDMARREPTANPAVVAEQDGLYYYNTITPEVVGLTEWATDEHSPIVGWAFDGLPIYGPYGYTDPTDTNSEITKVKSPWQLRSGTRLTGPGGAHTGIFIEDYQLGTAGAGVYTNAYNLRYSVTPDSPTQPIWFYVVTLDDNDQPAFPYHVGGGTVNADHWAGNYISNPPATGVLDAITVTDQGGLYTTATVTITGDGVGATATAVIADIDSVTGEGGQITGITIDNPGSGYTYATVTITGDGVRAQATATVGTTDNPNSAGYVATGATACFESSPSQSLAVTGNTQAGWIFSDGAPVENAWKLSEGYPFAVAEALLLAKPGRFATVFSDPIKLYRPSANPRKLLSTVDNRRWKFTDANHFVVHGETDSTGNFVSNIGYTQFINSWLTFQGLNIVDDFVTPMRTLGVKLAHRMNGYIDKDTMVVRTDQYSNDGKATSLIVPKENVNVTIHSSNYKSRNYYTGVIVEKTATGYRVKGYDRSCGFFEVLESDTAKGRQRVNVGGEPVAYTVWSPNSTFRKGTIVEHLGGYYQAPATLSTGDTFDRSVWTRLPSLPQENAASGVLYKETTGRILRVYYNTEFSTVQEVYDFLISLGRHQEYQGYNFGEYRTDINAVSDWEYSAKQFLFWTTGKWEIGNTIELSPLAERTIFEAPRGFIAKINRTDREQFSIVDHEGVVIDPRECEIERTQDRIVIEPPVGRQIYGVKLYVKEIEHALVFDNLTQFNDVIYNDVLFQKHSRIKLKLIRTLNWTGKLLSEGFIIDGDELLPNLDNMAESMGRYHELGFIPVEKQLYDTSRAMYGYSEREYLRELDILDEEQFDFYRGMIQSKGTQTSLTQIARSSAVVDGNVTVYDEWALRAGDFGDTENEQSVELKLTKSELVQDPQLISIVLPEDVTNTVDRIDVINPKFVYDTPPVIEISQPTLGGVRASAVASLDANGYLSAITVTNNGTGYDTATACVNILAANVVTDSRSTTIASATVSSNALIIGSSDLTITGNVALGGTVEFTLNDKIGGLGNIAFSVTSSGNVTPQEIVDAINSNASVNTNITASTVTTHLVQGNVSGEYHTLILTGKDFEVVDGANIGLVENRYQPRQRYQLVSPVNVPLSNSEVTLEVKVNNTVLTDNVHYTVRDGITSEITPTQQYPTPTYNGSEWVLGNATNVSFSLSGNLADSSYDPALGALDSEGKYRFVQVYINGTRITNSPDSYDGNVVTHEGTLFTLTQNSIVFPDISRLPNDVLDAYFNPPTSTGTTEQRELVYGLSANTEIKVVELSSFEFDVDYQGDIPGTTLSAKISTLEDIAVRMGRKRLYGVTIDNPNDDIITIDIDDNTRFLKKPIGEVGTRLWPTSNMVDATGFNDPAYPSIPNAGYVHPDDVNFRAFDIASIPDLFDRDIIIKPYKGSLIHVANAENKDWNVYKLNPIQGSISFLNRAADDKVSLYTNYSLFNYLDTNQIGEANTGKYLDYYLTLKNSTLSDNVVVWRNEDVIQSKQFKINDFKAPRMTEALISSIQPHNLVTIASIVPEVGKKYGGIQLVPTENSNVVTVNGNNFTTIASGDQIRLIDNIGTTVDYAANMSASGNVLTVNAKHVDSITITDGGAGYTEVPNVVFALSSTTSEYDRAQGVAIISGGLGSVTVISDGEVREATITDIVGDGTGAEAVARITDAKIVGFQITDPGFGYESNIEIAPPPSVTITGANTSPALANITIDDIGAGGEITLIRIEDAGDGYDADTITVTVDAPPSGKAATVVPILQGNVAVDVTSEGSGYTEAPEIFISGLGIESVSSTLNASVTGVTITYGGAGYTSAPSVAFEGANTSPATATTTVDTGVSELDARITAAGLGNVAIRLTGEADANLAFRVSPALTAQEQQTLDDINTVLAKTHFVTGINATNGTFTIVDDIFEDANVASNIVNQGYEVAVLQDFDDTLYEVYDATSTSFKIERANTLATDTAAFMHMNKSKLITTDPHPYSVNDIVRVYTDTIRGMYTVESVTANSLVISAPYIPNFTSGDIIQKGLEIKLAGDHGISPLYAAQGKRIAVHFAEPLYYNKVYPIGQVTGDTIIVDDYWPKDRQTHTFFEDRFGTVNGSVPYDASNIDADYGNATNIIDVTDNVRLNDFVATYLSNSETISPAYVTFSGNIAIIATDALPSNTEISVDIAITRQQLRESNRYPVLTTLDHNKVNINGAIIEVDNFNNPQAVADSIEKNIRLRESFTDVDKGKFNLSIPMLKDYRTEVAEGYAAGEISDYGSYIQDAAVISKLSNGALTAVEGNEIITETATDQVQDGEFKQPNNKVGPTKGLSYTTDEGIQYIWSPALQRYRPVNVGDVIPFEDTNHETNDEPVVPEFHFDSFDASAVSEWTATSPDVVTSEPDADSIIVYFTGDLVKKSGQYYAATQDVTMEMNQAFITTWWGIVTDESALEELYAEYLILKRVPGTATYNSVSNQPGIKRRFYNMLQYVTLSGTDMPKYRLMPNNQGLYYVYEAAQNDAGDKYYILVDKVPALAQPHDYFKTVSRYSDFGQYPTTAYYYDNGITPTVNGSNAITNTRDPIKMKRNAKVVELPPVEPAAYVGKQIIPEPFANASTNYSAIGNLTALPKIRVASNAPGATATIECESAGYNSFLLWTAGLTPGKWKPTETGPGNLPGLSGQKVSVGYGKGYYSANGSYPDGYPVTGKLTYNSSIPRFAYSSNFSVSPEVRNYLYPVYVAGVPADVIDDFVPGYYENSTNTVYGTRYNAPGDIDELQYTATAVFSQEEVDAQLDAGLTTIDIYNIDELVVADVMVEAVQADNENANNYGLRPEEIWVACFWTEPHVYANQLVGWNYDAIDASGLPTAIYADYNGTVVRFKYIRLNELPENVVTRRPIPDTGWAGKAWDNLRVDDITIENTPENEIWDLFDSTPVVSGSTGTPAEAVSVNVGDVATTTGIRGTSTGVVPAEIIDSIPNQNNVVVPSTQFGPVLTGAVLEGLPGPCTPPGDPYEDPIAKPIESSCYNKTVKRIKQYISNSSDSYREVGGYTSGRSPYGVISTKIAGKGDYRVFFDFRAKSNNNASIQGAALAIVQSTVPYPSGVGGEQTEWWGLDSTIVLVDTRTNGGTVVNNGTQIGVYGKTPYNVNGEKESDEITSLLGLTSAQVAENTQLRYLQAGATRATHLPSRYDNDSSVALGVDGIGFLVKYGLDCGKGEYITVFVSEAAQSDIAGRSPVWDIVIDYQTEPRVIDPSSAEVEFCDNADAPSRAYQQGAIWSEWYSSKTQGYFGQNSSDGEFDSSKKRSVVDNIYYPYNPSKDLITWYHEKASRGNVYNTEPKNKWAGHPDVKKATTRMIQKFDKFTFSGTMRTVEVKGYFRAPVTGTYRFGGRADDGLWVWISSTFDGFTQSSNEKGGYIRRTGVNEFGEIRGKLENERNGQNAGSGGQAYFIKDGAPKEELPFSVSRAVHRTGGKRKGELYWDSDEYMESYRYHRDNCVVRTGFRTTNDRGNNDTIFWGINSVMNAYEAEVHVELQEGQYYFMRFIFGNESGPGHARIVYDVLETGLKNQTLTFSGKWCPSDNPPAGNGDYVPGGELPSEDILRDVTTSQDRAYLACTSEKGIDSRIIGEPTYEQAQCYFESYKMFPPNTPESMKDAIITTNETIPDWVTNADYIARQIANGTATPEQVAWYERYVASGKPETPNGMMTEEQYAEYLASGGARPNVGSTGSTSSTGTTYPYYSGSGQPANTQNPTNPYGLYGGYFGASQTFTSSSSTTVSNAGAGTTNLNFLPKGTLVSVACETEDGFNLFGAESRTPINTGRILYVYADGEGGTYTEAEVDTQGLCPAGKEPGTITVQTGGTGGGGASGSADGGSWDKA